MSDQNDPWRVQAMAKRREIHARGVAAARAAIAEAKRAANEAVQPQLPELDETDGADW